MTCQHRRPRACCMNAACREAHWQFRPRRISAIVSAAYRFWRDRSTDPSRGRIMYDDLREAFTS